ncbi:MAG TPA: DUF6293 family protein [Candidatus Desulfaltia sp.]|nr:DUF6293 family protein [Candidatus Desulfaltia sp.]
MSIALPRLNTRGGGVESVHVVPLEDEIDRAVRVFEVENGFKANKVYLLAWVPEGFEGVNRDLVYYHGEVRRRLGRLGLEVVTVLTNIFDMLEVIKRVSAVVRAEKERGNTVYVNMSAGGPFVSVGTAMAAMVQDARLYYVRCNRYSQTPEEKMSHGNAVVTTPQVHFIENFKIQLPDERGVRVLVELFGRGEMRTGDILRFLYREGVEGFAEEDPDALSREEKMTVLMRLNKGVTGKLEAAGYIEKERRGRENLYRVTESGKYVACVSGRV